MLKAIANLIDYSNEQIGKAVSWLTTALVLLVCFDVITRYLLSETDAWVMELEWHLFSMVFLLGAGYAFKHDRHVRVDLFYANFSDREKAWVNLIGGVVFLIPWCILVGWAALKYASISYSIGEGSPDPGGLPARWFIKFAIAFGIILLLLQAISSVLRAIFVLRGSEK